jgi:hypothetical protein
MLPVIIDNDFEISMLNKDLIDKLTSDCSSVLRMLQVVVVLIFLY